MAESAFRFAVEPMIVEMKESKLSSAFFLVEKNFVGTIGRELPISKYWIESKEGGVSETD